MESYLHQCKENSKNIIEDEVLIVLGNESCDLDTAVSSIVLAFFLSQTQFTKGSIFPVLNVKRADLKLHSEVAFFLEETSISLDDLICKDEIDIKNLATERNLKVVLVDHNVLSTEDSYLQPYVTYVIDHHVLENPRLEQCTLKIELVGSCCTLVAEEILNQNATLLDPQIAMLLYGTILLDTVCLEESAKRVTEKDKLIVSKLEELLEGISQEEVFQALQNAKFDVSGFSPKQLFNKDLKVVSSDTYTVAISSIPVLLENVVNSESTLPELIQFCNEGQYQAVILLGSQISKDGKSIHRQIAVFSVNDKILNDLTDFLKSLDNPSLELQPVSTITSSLLLYEQNNITLTRKFVLPAVRNFLVSDVNSEDAINSEMDGSLVNYQTETLDFPDSPTHDTFLKFNLQSKEEQESSVNSVFDTPREIHERQTCTGESDGGSVTSSRKKISVHPSVLYTVNDDQRSLSSLSNKSDTEVFSPADDVVLPEDDIDTPEELENSDNSLGLESSLSEPIPEMSAAGEYAEERSWKMCVVGGEEKRIDMKVIEPYKKVLSHGGYQGETRNAIIVFTACYLPDRSRNDYDYVMDNLFLYVLATLDHLVADNYVLVYFHGATERGNMPSFGWLKRCYQMIDRRLRKNLKGLYLVHPTFWLKTIVIMTRPFISSKFSRKLRFVNCLEELSSLIPMDHVYIADKIKKLEFERMIKMKKKEMKNKVVPNSLFSLYFIVRDTTTK